MRRSVRRGNLSDRSGTFSGIGTDGVETTEVMLCGDGGNNKMITYM